MSAARRASVWTGAATLILTTCVVESCHVDSGSPVVSCSGVAVDAGADARSADGAVMARRDAAIACLGPSSGATGSSGSTSIVTLAGGGGDNGLGGTGGTTDFGVGGTTDLGTGGTGPGAIIGIGMGGTTGIGLPGFGGVGF
jgi:hypothetical protein